MEEGPLRGIARIRAAWRNSAQGFRDIWRSDEAFRLECAALVLAVPASAFVAKSLFDAAVLIAAVLLVLLVEVLNSAIEATVDRIGPERHELSRIAKDLGSLAVLIAIAIAGLVWAGALFDFAF